MRIYHLSLFILLTLLAACDSNQQSESVANEKSGSTAVDDGKLDQENQSAGVSEADILAAKSSGWLSHGRTYSEQRHSPLAKINSENVSELGLHWSYDLGTSRGIEVTPIVYNGVMYITSTWNIVHALDARTGEKLWSFDPAVDKEQAAKGCCDVVNRGVAIWGDSIFTGTIDGRLISLDATTGAKNWDVNTIDKTKAYTITGAPRVVNGIVVIGNGGAEFGVRGYFSGYDANTGEMLWRFFTVPGNPDDGFESKTMVVAAKTWNGNYWEAGGGGTAWDSMAYDPELDLLYVGVGNGSPWNQDIRSPDGGDNLFLSSIVAVRPATGEYVWHYQTTPGETWDYTATQHMILANLTIEGIERKVIMQAPKNGFFYVLDRETGEFISAENFVPTTWASHIDPNTGRPVETENARNFVNNQDIQLPGPLGAHNWHPMSYSPDTGLVYIPAQEAPWIYNSDENYQFKEGVWNTGTDFSFAVLPSDAATFKAFKALLKGQLLAWDPVAQKAAWAFDHQGPWNGGILSTSGGLVFQGTADAHFGAYDATTGERLWKYFTQTGVVAAPVTYELDGEQYVAVAAGWGGSYVLGFGGVLPTGSEVNIGRMLVFKLGARQSLPEINTPNVAITNTIPEPLDASEETLTKGSHAYANTCLACHGDQAYSSGLIPNLRYSPITGNADAWSTIVMDGALAERGMPNFGKLIDSDTAEAIRAYVIHEANNGLDREFYESE